MELDTRIETTRKRRFIYVDEHEGGVWLNLVVEAARCHVTMTKEQTQELINALTKIVETSK
jgi:hypothetical protein